MEIRILKADKFNNGKGSSNRGGFRFCNTGMERMFFPLIY